MSTYIPLMLPVFLFLFIAAGAFIGRAGIKSLHENQRALREDQTIAEFEQSANAKEL